MCHSQRRWYLICTYGLRQQSGISVGQLVVAQRHQHVCSLVLVKLPLKLTSTVFRRISHPICRRHKCSRKTICFRTSFFAAVNCKMSRTVTLPLRFLHALSVRTQPTPLLTVKLLPNSVRGRYDLSLIEVPIRYGRLRSAESRISRKSTVASGKSWWPAWAENSILAVTRVCR